MIAVGIRYLCGWSAATDPSSYEETEWPPHPARVFMALVAAHFETVEEGSTEEMRERSALEWIERQPPPELRVSPAERPKPLTSYVPVNDPEISARIDPATASDAVVAHGASLIPDHRSRQPRMFPRAIPHEDTVWMTWTDEPPADVLKGMRSLVPKVTRIGHSSSLVQVWVETKTTPESNLIPASEAVSTRLRVPGEGLLEELEARFEAGLHPAVSLWAGYRDAAEEMRAPHTLFDPNLQVVKLVPMERAHRSLPLDAARDVIHRFRQAVISVADEPVPEILSGHAKDRKPIQRPHVAFLPVPFVDHRHADGHILGLAFALPRDLASKERAAVNQALARLSSSPGNEDEGKLRLGRLGRWKLEPIGAATVPWTLRSEAWTRPSTHWASVTPVVLDRFTHDPEEKQSIIADACVRIGLPRPSAVRLSHVSPFRGVPPSHDFGPLDSGRGKPVRPFAHVLLAFSDENGEPLRVEGPLLIGAGRYRGYGLLRPYDLERSHPWTP